MYQTKQNELCVPELTVFYDFRCSDSDRDIIYRCNRHLDNISGPALL